MRPMVGRIWRGAWPPAGRPTSGRPPPGHHGFRGTRQPAGRDQDRAEEELRDREERYRLLFETTEDGMLVTAPDGRILFANPAACRMLGRTEEEVRAAGRNGVVDVNDPRLAAALEERSRTGHVRTKLTMVRKDGSRFVADVTSTVFRDRKGELRTSMFMRDISQRELMEQALRHSEEQFRLLFHNAPFGAALYRLVYDAQGRVVDLRTLLLNERGAERLQRKPEELIGRTITDLFGAELTAPYLDICRQVVASGEPKEFEAHLPFSGRDHLFVVFLVGKDLYAALSIDITERKRLEAERDLLASAIAQSHDVVLVTDTNGRIRYANPAFEASTGYTPDEAVGRNAGFLKSGELPPLFYKELWETITRGEVWRGQFINCKKDGTRFVEQSTISPVRDGSGAIVSYVAVKRDITRELDLEARLRQAQRMESVGRLAGGIAHDFNNMLSVIMGRTDLAACRREVPSTVLSDLLEVKNAAVRASDMTRQLLAFARKQPISPRVLDLNDQVQGTLKMLRPLIGEQIELVWSPGEDLWPVHMDPTQLDQILMNLALNARDAIDGTGRITIETSNSVLDQATYVAQGTAPAGDYVLMSVRDTGRGMDRAIVEHVFEPFFTTKEQGQGTGLGLAIVYGIVSQNGGFVHVYSEPGHGTVFRLYLPRLAHVVEQEPADSAEHPIVGGTETVLLVEDEDMILQFARTALEQLGYTVLVADSPRVAERVFCEHADRIQLLLTDVVMPEMTGQELAKRLCEARPGLKVLLMSGYPADGPNQEVVMRGVPFLQKPFSVPELSARVREALGN